MFRAMLAMVKMEVMVEAHMLMTTIVRLVSRKTGKLGYNGPVRYIFCYNPGSGNSLVCQGNAYDRRSATGVHKKEEFYILAGCT